MTKKEIDRIIANIDKASGTELNEALAKLKRDNASKKGVSTSAGAALGAIIGSLSGKSEGSKLARSLAGALLGAAGGMGLGSLLSSKDSGKIYGEISKRRSDEIDKVLSGIDKEKAEDVRAKLDASDRGVKVNDVDYGYYLKGRGVYSDDDKLKLKRDKDGSPVLSLMFAGINSSVEDGASAKASSPNAAVFYNKNRNKFSDVQSNTIFDYPVIADAYVDKIAAKIMSSRAKSGKYPKIRLIGYSAGGRGVVNFLKKMRERDPNFKVDEIVGIDAYQRPWENIPPELRDPNNPVADKIVYSRPFDKYTGSHNKGVSRVVDAIKNTFVASVGKQLKGLSANRVVDDYVHNVAHNDAEIMYNSALRNLAKM